MSKKSPLKKLKWILSINTQLAESAGQRNAQNHERRDLYVTNSIQTGKATNKVVPKCVCV